MYDDLSDNTIGRMSHAGSIATITLLNTRFISNIFLLHHHQHCHHDQQQQQQKTAHDKEDKEESIPAGEFVKEIRRFDTPPVSVYTFGKTLYVAFSNGTFVALPEHGFLPKKQIKQKRSAASGIAEKETAQRKKQTDEAKKTKTTRGDDDEDDDKLFETEDVIGSKPRSTFIDDEADDDDDDEDDEADGRVNNQGAGNSTTSGGDTGGDDESGDGDETIDGISINRDNDDDDLGLDNELGDEDMIDGQDNDREGFGQDASAAGRMMFAPKPQAPFAPASTPLDLPRRIMCWNHEGAITLQRNDGDSEIRNTVEISFTNSAFKRPVIFTDNMDFIVGSLGEDGALFATDLEDDDDDEDNDGDYIGDGKDDAIRDVVEGLNMSDRMKSMLKRSQRKSGESGVASAGSSLYFHRFDTFGPLKDKDWHMTLPVGERVLGCATGEGWAACVTSRRFLRIYSSGGNQTRVLWLPGDPVTMVGRSSFVAVFYHASSPLPDGTQKLGFLLYDAVSMNEVVSGPVACISSRGNLAWAAFSKERSLVVMDSDGMVSMLAVSAKTSDAVIDNGSGYSFEWTPVLDTLGLRKSMEDSFWPVTSQDGKLVCVPLKGGNQYPDAARRPVTTALPFRMPLARGVLEKT